MRAFTAKDRKDIKLVAQNYPSTKFYDTETLLTELGIGEAIVTVLNEKGSPTPLAHTMLCAPRTRMDISESTGTGWNHFSFKNCMRITMMDRPGKRL